MKTTDKAKLISYLNSSKADDNSFIPELYSDSKNDAELMDIAQKMWDETSAAPMGMKHMLNEIHRRIGVPAQTVRRDWMAVCRKVAAVLMLPLLIGCIYLLAQRVQENTYSEITAPGGSKTRFVLPDGTSGYLNSESTLRYKASFTESRNVELEGEAYFEVVKNSRSPFIVKTRHTSVQVYGTKFDVCAYTDESEVLTTLVEGSVKVTSHKTNVSTMMQPGQQVICDTKTGGMRTKSVNTELYTTWRNEILKFCNTPFDVVARKMERWYGVKLSYPASMKRANFTFTARNEGIKEILNLLSITTPIQYTIKKDTVYIKPLQKVKKE